MFALITGGSGSGKSRYAEEYVNTLAGEKLYLATMEAWDEESRRRIRRHRKMRAGKGFHTVECPRELSTLSFTGRENILLEDLGNLLANEMFGGAQTDPALRILSDIRKIRTEAAHLTIVTNEICSGGLDYEPGTLAYMKQLGTLNCVLAAEADFVCEVTAGMPNILKGGA